MVVLVKQSKAHYKDFIQYITTDILKVNNEILIFGSVGALGKYIQEIDTIGKQVTNILVHINASEFFVFVFLIYFIWGLSVIAIHPSITLTLVLSSVD